MRIRTYTEWCLCRKCQPIESETESSCFLDTNEVPDDYFEEKKCITSSEGFNTVCLSKIVLKTALSAINDLRGDSLNDANKCAYRYTRYKHIFRKGYSQSFSIMCCMGDKKQVSTRRWKVCPICGK